MVDRGTDVMNIKYDPRYSTLHPKMNVQYVAKGTFLHTYAAQRHYIFGNKLRQDNVQQVFEYIIGEGVNATSLDELGRTALHCAVLGEDWTLSYLIERHRLNVNAADFQGRTPLHFATFVWCEDTMTALLRAGARVDVVDIDGNTPLHAHAELGSTMCVSMVRLLIRAGASRAAKNNDGMTHS
eukprot:GILI01008479.1.p1 GENE.GILI01008479.1~~GILI01008479.1.p1  ORF type:complete len:183 (-),score=13.66 GILI01008479.1:25-573(-)